jgi:hypothetical protein
MATAAPTAQEVQALRGRITQLEAELAAATTPTGFVEFVGDAYGHNGQSMDHTSTGTVALQVVGRSAHYHANLQYDRWKVDHPNCIVLSKRVEMVSHPIAYNGSAVVTNVSVIIHVTYREG